MIFNVLALSVTALAVPPLPRGELADPQGLTERAKTPKEKISGKIRRFFRRSNKNINSAEDGQSEPEAISIVSLSQTRTISGVISAMLWAPHICMVSASSPASLSM